MLDDGCGRGRGTGWGAVERTKRMCKGIVWTPCLVVQGNPAGRIGIRRPGGRAREKTGVESGIRRMDGRRIWVMGPQRGSNMTGCSKLVGNGHVDTVKRYAGGATFPVEPPYW